MFMSPVYKKSIKRAVLLVVAYQLDSATGFEDQTHDDASIFAHQNIKGLACRLQGHAFQADTLLETGSKDFAGRELLPSPGPEQDQLWLMAQHR
jgi:hypothetical protein